MISVVIPAFNAANTLPRCLDSCMWVLDEGGEVIVVDDGSTDQTADVALRRSGCQLVRQPNRGRSAARNAGARQASCPLVIFLDSDDELVLNARAVFIRSATDRVGLLRAGAVVKRGGHVRVVPPGPYAGLDDHVAVGPFYPGSYAVSREIFLSSGGFDERLAYGENTDLVYRIAAATTAAGRPIRVDPEVTVTVHQEEDPHRKYVGRRGEAARLIMDKHASTFARMPSLRASYLGVIAYDAAVASEVTTAVGAALRAAAADRSLHSLGRFLRVAFMVVGLGPRGVSRVGN